MGPSAAKRAWASDSDRPIKGREASSGIVTRVVARWLIAIDKAQERHQRHAGRDPSLIWLNERREAAADKSPSTGDITRRLGGSHANDQP